MTTPCPTCHRPPADPARPATLGPGQSCACHIDGLDDTGPAVGIVAAPEPPRAPVTHDEAREAMRRGAPHDAVLHRYITEQEARDAAREALERRAEEAERERDKARTIVEAAGRDERFVLGQMYDALDPGDTEPLWDAAARLRQERDDARRECVAAVAERDEWKRAAEWSGWKWLPGAELPKPPLGAPRRPCASCSHIPLVESMDNGLCVECVARERDEARAALRDYQRGAEEDCQRLQDEREAAEAEATAALAMVGRQSLALDAAREELARAKAEMEILRSALVAPEPSSLAAAGWPWERRKATYIAAGPVRVTMRAVDRALAIVDAEYETVQAGDSAAVTAAMVAELERLAADCDDGNPCTKEDETP